MQKQVHLFVFIQAHKSIVLLVTVCLMRILVLNIDKVFFGSVCGWFVERVKSLSGHWEHLQKSWWAGRSAVLVDNKSALQLLPVSTVSLNTGSGEEREQREQPTDPTDTSSTVSPGFTAEAKWVPFNERKHGQLLVKLTH